MSFLLFLILAPLVAWAVVCVAWAIDPEIAKLLGELIEAADDLASRDD